eukprot:scaffold39062_cov75-Phaeocystis_antarctica.AAC.4
MRARANCSSSILRSVAHKTGPAQCAACAVRFTAGFKPPTLRGITVSGSRGDFSFHDSRTISFLPRAARGRWRCPPAPGARARTPRPGNILYFLPSHNSCFLDMGACASAIHGPSTHRHQPTLQTGTRA